MDRQNQLAQLYAQKGELLTEMEIMQSQLQRINQQIIQIKNAIMKEMEEQKIKDSKKETADQKTKASKDKKK